MFFWSHTIRSRPEATNSLDEPLRPAKATKGSSSFKIGWKDSFAVITLPSQPQTVLLLGRSGEL